MGNSWCAPIPNFILEEKLENYLANESYVYAAIFHFSISTGMAIGDMLNLKVADVKGKDRITIYNLSRATDAYTVMFDKRTLEYNNQLCQGKEDNDYLFVKPGMKKPPKQASVNRNIRTAGEAYGLQGLSSISLRKTHFLHIFKAYGIQRVTKLLGHNSMNVTMKYLGISNSDGCYTECKERDLIIKDNYGIAHINNIISTLSSISDIISNPTNPDIFYTDLVKDISSIERVLAPYKKYTDSISKQENPE